METVVGNESCHGCIRTDTRPNMPIELGDHASKRSADLDVMKVVAGLLDPSLSLGDGRTGAGLGSPRPIQSKTCFLELLLGADPSRHGMLFSGKDLLGIGDIDLTLAQRRARRLPFRLSNHECFSQLTSIDFG